MPCRTNRFRVTVPHDLPSELQWVYDTTRPLDDDVVKKAGTFGSTNVDADDNVCVEHNEAASVKVTREVPYYDPADDEEKEEAQVVALNSAGVSAAVLELQPTAVVVGLPDIEAEVHHVFPCTAAIPPPPPTAFPSAKAMCFWFRRLVAHPIYARCVRIVRADCPPPPVAGTVDAMQMWMAACDRWWNSLAALVSRTSSTYRLPKDKAWNPYSFTQSATFTDTPARSRGADPDTMLSIASANYFLPPPPSYLVVVSEYRRIVSEVDAHRAYVECLLLWWRRACQWAAVSSRQHAWVCPPPTTGADAEDWAMQCEQWRTFTSVQLREEERRSRAVELGRMMSAFQEQQSMASSMNDSSALCSHVNQW